MIKIRVNILLLSPYFFMGWRLIKYRNNFTSYERRNKRRLVKITYEEHHN
jgi:hypothetical protein